MMGRATGFHDDAIDLSIGEEALELSAAQAVLLHDAVIGIGDGVGRRSLQDRWRR
jgi:hypothetical protein